MTAHHRTLPHAPPPAPPRIRPRPLVWAVLAGLGGLGGCGTVGWLAYESQAQQRMNECEALPVFDDRQRCVAALRAQPEATATGRGNPATLPATPAAAASAARGDASLCYRQPSTGERVCPN